MEIYVKNKVYRLGIYLSFAILFLSGCESTTTSNTEAECRPQNTQSCEDNDGNGNDRGYDPCLINKNLPICKTDG